MGGKSSDESAWTNSPAPNNVYSPAAAADGTYQAAAEVQGKLHMFVSDVAVYVEGGTGAAVTSTDKQLWGAYVPLFFRPRSGRESLGWTSVSGNAKVGVSVIEE